MWLFKSFEFTNFAKRTSKSIILWRFDMPNPNFSVLAATTLKNYRNQMADNLTGHEALLYELKSKGFMRTEDGGLTIVEPLMYGRNTTVKSYDGYDVLDTTPQTGITAAEFAWKQVAGTVSISGREEFINMGSKTKVINLLKTKIMQLDTSMELEVSRMLHGDGTGNGGKDLTGLGILVEDGAAWSTVGGIDSNVDVWWRNQWIGGTATFASVGLARMTTIYNSVSRKNVRPRLILTDQYLFEQYEAKLVPNERFLDTRLGDAGFLNLTFKGTPIVFDQDMPFEDLATDEHQMLFLTTEYLNFVVGKGKDFVVSDFVSPTDQDAKLSNVILYANMTVSNRGRNGRLTDLT
jgi:hypothetical protein